LQIIGTEVLPKLEKDALREKMDKIGTVINTHVNNAAFANLEEVREFVLPINESIRRILQIKYYHIIYFCYSNILRHLKDAMVN
jgi:hypothetical protein